MTADILAYIDVMYSSLYVNIRLELYISTALILKFCKPSKKTLFPIFFWKICKRFLCIKIFLELFQSFSKVKTEKVGSKGQNHSP